MEIFRGISLTDTESEIPWKLVDAKVSRFTVTVQKLSVITAVLQMWWQIYRVAWWLLLLQIKESKAASTPSGIQNRPMGSKQPEDHWSCIAHQSAEDMLKSAVTEEKEV